MTTPLAMDIVSDLVTRSVEQARRDGFLQLDTVPDVQLERPANPQHGDFATSLPLRLARATRINPLQLAEGLVKLIPADEQVQRVEAAPPGFINFYLRDSWIQQQVDAVRQAGPGVRQPGPWPRAAHDGGVRQRQPHRPCSRWPHQGSSAGQRTVQHPRRRPATT